MGLEVSAQPSRPQKRRKTKPLPARVWNEVLSSTDTTTDKETEDLDDHISGLGRSLSDFQLDKNPVCSIYLLAKGCL